jgi:hypothetical protein
MMDSKNITILIFLSIIVADCNGSDPRNMIDDKQANECVEVYIPEQQEIYAPRDFQVKVNVEKAYLLPRQWPIVHPWQSIGFNAKFNTKTESVSPTEKAPSDDIDVISISLETSLADAIKLGFDKRRSPSSASLEGLYTYSGEKRYGLYRGTNNRQSRIGGPIDQVFVDDLINPTIVISCWNPGNETVKSCELRYIYDNNITNSDIATSSMFSELRTILFRYEQIGKWANIKSTVDKFWDRRVTISPFISRYKGAQ